MRNLTIHGATAARPPPMSQKKKKCVLLRTASRRIVKMKNFVCGEGAMDIRCTGKKSDRYFLDLLWIVCAHFSCFVFLSLWTFFFFFFVKLMHHLSRIPNLFFFFSHTAIKDLLFGREGGLISVNNILGCIRNRTYKKTKTTQHCFIYRKEAILRGVIVPMEI